MFPALWLLVLYRSKPVTFSSENVRIQYSFSSLYFRCHSCGGAGSITCKTCKGQGKLLCFIRLKITWWEDSGLHPFLQHTFTNPLFILLFVFFYLLRKNNIYVAVIDKGSGFPVELLDQITGEKLLTDMAPVVSKTSWGSQCLCYLMGS